MGRTQPDAGWTFSIARGIAGWQTLSRPWQALVDGCAEASVLQQPAWYGAYLHHLCRDPERVVFVSAWRRRTLAAVLPLEIAHQQVGTLHYREARLITHAHMVLADMAADPRTAVECWPLLLDWLQSRRALPWDVLQLEGVCRGACLDAALTTRPATMAFAEPLRDTAWLDCRGTVDQALAQVGRAHHANVRRLRRRAETRAPLRFDVIDDLAGLDAALNDFLAVESSGWKADAGTAIAHHQPLQRFYQTLMQQFGQRHACRIHLLRHGDDVIAAQFVLVGGRQMNLLKIGYQESCADIAPGHLIMREAVEAACADPDIDRLSFVTHPPWAHLWKPQITPVLQHSIFHPSWRGWALYQVARGRRWLRDHPAGGALTSPVSLLPAFWRPRSAPAFLPTTR
jgi:CelD/BcsL family acetyltransferase involved in cellulose biosynthesis